jgi:Sel1 repeat-containing protein
MFLRFPVALVLSLVCLAAPAWAGLKEADEAYNRGDYATAAKELRTEAGKGNSLAQSKLGWLYANGKGVPQDYTQARQWYEKAAAQGYAQAQTNLGMLYYNGDGVPQDYVQARQWYEKAAAQVRNNRRTPGLQLSAHFAEAGEPGFLIIHSREGIPGRIEAVRLINTFRRRFCGCHAAHPAVCDTDKTRTPRRKAVECEGVKKVRRVSNPHAHAADSSERRTAPARETISDRDPLSVFCP